MEPGRNTELQNCDPIRSSRNARRRSPGDFRSFTAPSRAPNLRATPTPRFRAGRARADRRSSSLPPHAVAVAVLVVPLVLIAVPGGHAGAAHDDHTGGTAVDTQAAPGAHVLMGRAGGIIID